MRYLRDILDPLIKIPGVESIGLFRDWLVDSAGLSFKYRLQCYFIYDAYVQKDREQLFFKVPKNIFLSQEITTNLQKLLRTEKNEQQAYLLDEDDIVERLVPLFAAELEEYSQKNSHYIAFYQCLTIKMNQEQLDRIHDDIEKVMKRHKKSMRESDILEHTLFKMAGVSVFPDSCQICFARSGRIVFEFISADYAEENIQLLLNLFKNHGDMSAYVHSACRDGRIDEYEGYIQVAYGFENGTHMDPLQPPHPIEIRPVIYLMSINAKLFAENIVPKLNERLILSPPGSRHYAKHQFFKTIPDVPPDFEWLCDETSDLYYVPTKAFKAQLGQFGYENFLLFKNVDNLDAISYFVEKNPLHLHQINSKGQTIRTLAKKLGHDDVVSWIDNFLKQTAHASTIVSRGV